MKESSLVRIFAGTEILVNLLKGILEERGIEGIIQNDYQSGLNAGFSGGIPSAIDLFVKEVDFKDAEPIINEFIQHNK